MESDILRQHSLALSPWPPKNLQTPHWWPRRKKAFKTHRWLTVTVNESQIEIPAERGQDFVWRVEQKNKKTYLKFDTGENGENVGY